MDQLVQLCPQRAQRKERYTKCCLHAPHQGSILGHRERASVAQHASVMAGSNTTHLWVRWVTKVPVVVTIIGTCQKREKGNK